MHSSHKDSSDSRLRALYAAFPHTIPVLTGFLFLGLAYGVLMRTKGYPAIWSLLFSSLVFGGSIQYAAITLLTTAFDPVHALLLSLIVNARHLFYGLSMLSRYRGLGKIKPLLIFWMCDETFSIVCCTDSPDNIPRGRFFFWISFLNYLYWVIGSFLGGLLGNYLFFNTKGLDFALTALFVVIFVEQFGKRDNRLTAAVGVCCTLLSLLLFGSGNFLIPAMGLILLTLTFLRRPLTQFLTHHEEDVSCR